MNESEKVHEALAPVKLKNGAEEPSAVVTTTMMAIDSLMAEGRGMLVYELHEMCKDQKYQPWGTSVGEQLEAAALIEGVAGDYRVHDSVRSIVLAPAEGEGGGLTMGDPRA